MRSSKLHRFAFSAVLLPAFVLGAMAQVPTAATTSGQNTMPVAPMPATVEEAPAILIGPGDMLNLVTFETPELSTAVRVNQNGDANIPVLGPVQLSGLTPTEAAQKIENGFQQQGLLLNPHVTIQVAEFASQGATVLGEVHTPGIYPTLGSRRLLDMISLAGGVSTTAGRLVSIVHKNDPTHPHQIALQPTPASLHAQDNPVILPGDTVVIAKAGVVYVLGDVSRPGGILVDNNERLSVVQAVSLAGGLNKTAAMSQARLVRKLPAGREEIDMDLKHILYGKQADVLVSDGDILYIPTSVGKTVLLRSVEAIFNVATQAYIFTQL